MEAWNSFSSGKIHQKLLSSLSIKPDMRFRKNLSNFLRESSFFRNHSSTNHHQILEFKASEYFKSRKMQYYTSRIIFVNRHLIVHVLLYLLLFNWWNKCKYHKKIDSRINLENKNRIFEMCTSFVYVMYERMRNKTYSIEFSSNFDVLKTRSENFSSVCFILSSN